VSDLVLPAEAALALGGAIAAGFAALWRGLSRERADGAMWQRRWADEVKASAAAMRRGRRLIEQQAGRKPSDPPESWDETTGVQNVLLQADRRWIERQCKGYIASDPPDG
jgi:hypothetical protein